MFHFQNKGGREEDDFLKCQLRKLVQVVYFSTYENPLYSTSGLRKIRYTGKTRNDVLVWFGLQFMSYNLNEGKKLR